MRWNAGVKINPLVKRAPVSCNITGYSFYKVNNTAADALAEQGFRAWSPTILTHFFLNDIQQSLTHWGRNKNGRHFADDIFKCILLNENVWIMITNSLKFVPKGPINDIPALLQIMAWRRPGDKPLSEPMLVSLPTHICVTWPQWVKDHHSDGYRCQQTGPPTTKRPTGCRPTDLSPKTIYDYGI